MAESPSKTPGAFDPEALLAAQRRNVEVLRTWAARQPVGGGRRIRPRFFLQPVELLDRVMSTVSDMVLARNELARRLRESETDVPVDGAFERLSSIISSTLGSFAPAALFSLSAIQRAPSASL